MSLFTSVNGRKWPKPPWKIFYTKKIEKKPFTFDEMKDCVVRANGYYNPTTVFRMYVPMLDKSIGVYMGTLEDIYEKYKKDCEIKK